MATPKTLSLALLSLLAALFLRPRGAGAQSPIAAELEQRLDLFSRGPTAAGSTSLATRPTALLGPTLDGAVVERMLRARLQDVQSQVLRDVLVGELAGLRECQPCIDLVTTVAALATQTMDGDARSAALTTMSVRVGLAFTLATLPTSLLGSCGDARPGQGQQYLVRVNAAYDGLRRSSWLGTLGFPVRSEESTPVGTCVPFSQRVTRTVDTVGRLGSDLASFQHLVDDVGRVQRSCRDVHIGTELDAALGALVDRVAASLDLRELREIRNAFARVRPELGGAAPGDVLAPCVRSLQGLQSHFDDLLARVASDIDQDATLSALLRNVTSLVDPASIEEVTRGQNVRRALDRIDLASSLDPAPPGAANQARSLTVLELRRLADVLAGASIPPAFAAADSLRLQDWLLAAPLPVERLRTVLNEGVSCLGSAPGVVPAVPSLLPFQRADDVSRLTPHELAGLLVLVGPALVAPNTTDSCRTRLSTMATVLTPIARSTEADVALWWDARRLAAPATAAGLRGILSELDDDAVASQRATIQQLLTAAARSTAGLDVTSIGQEITRRLKELNDNPDFRVVRDLAQRLASRQPLRRGDVVAMAARIRAHLDPRLEQLARNEGRWRLVKRLVDVLLDAVPNALVEDDSAPGGLRFDVASLVSTLAGEFAQQDRVGFYVRATVGAGYVVTSGGDAARPFYEEIGFGYRWSALNHRLLLGPHLAASGLLYQLQSLGPFREPVFLGVGFSVNLYRALDVSANAGVLVDVAAAPASPNFAVTIGLQLPLADYVAAIASGSGASTTTTSRGGSAP